MKKLFLIVAIGIIKLNLLAQPGTLDNTFGSGGKVITAIGSSFDYGFSVAIQSDGKIVVAGESSNGTNYDFALVRYNTIGTLDNTFGTNGKVTTAIGSSQDHGNSVTIQSDGKIVVAGDSYIGTDIDFALVRYNINGTVDNTFGTGGKVTTGIGSSGDWGKSVAIQNDGKLVVAGYSNNGTNNDFALVRYNTNGILDNTFGTGGKVTTAIGSYHDVGLSVAIQSDGKIVVAGGSSNGTNYDFALVRYNTIGTLDNTFGTNGKVTTSIGSSNASINSVTIQSDGKIVAAGHSNNGTNDDFALLRYNTNGTLDNTFGTGGKVTTSIGSSDASGQSVTIQNDGKIVLAGYSSNGFTLVRYNISGTLDNTFGTNGKVTTAIGSSLDYGYSVALQSDGKIVVAGASSDGTNYTFAVVRYNNTVTGIVKSLYVPCSILPNPSTGVFSIQFETPVSENHTIEVYNLLGEKIYATISDKRITEYIDISYSPKGIYFVKINDREKIHIEKIVKQ